jgi:hypothetical protein
MVMYNGQGSHAFAFGRLEDCSVASDYESPVSCGLAFAPQYCRTQTLHVAVMLHLHNRGKHHPSVIHA